MLSYPLIISYTASIFCLSGVRVSQGTPTHFLIDLLDDSIVAGERIIAKLKRNILWDDHKDLKPSEKEHKRAYTIGTGLFGLSKEKIELLSKEAEWKVLMQMRLYLPMLLN